MAEIGIQVCYALPDRQFLKALRVQEGITLRKAIELSELLQVAPEIDIDTARVGIYGKLKTLDTVLRDHDRVEVYRPLIADPKDARRRRAGKKVREG